MNAARLKIRLRQPMKMFSVAAVILCVFGALSLTPKSYAAYSQDPRQLGEVILDELLVGSGRFMIRVASNGGTDKSSFKVDVKQEQGSAAQTPHYMLTVNRIKVDDCKAIVRGGTLILFDLEKDLGLKGDFTYTFTNPVRSSTRVPVTDDSLFSIIEKYFTYNASESKAVKSEPFETFVMDHHYFSCSLPTDWKVERDRDGDEAAGIFEIRLTMSDKAQPEEYDRYLLPDPLIYAGYYSKNNQLNKSYEGYIKDYEQLAEKRAGNKASRYEKPKEIDLIGTKAVEITYEVYQEEPHGPLATLKYWLKARFILIKAQDGFYILAYKSPKEFYDRYLPTFDEVVKTFKM